MLPLRGGQDVSITPEQLAEWKRLAEKATPGPWTHEYLDDSSVAINHPVEVEHDGERYTMEDWLLMARKCDSCRGSDRRCYMPSHADTQFIASAREAVPALIAEVERLQEVAAGLREERCTHVGGVVTDPWCGG